MKKVLALFAVAACISFAACNNEAGEGTEGEHMDTTTTTTTPSEDMNNSGTEMKSDTGMMNSDTGMNKMGGDTAHNMDH